MHYCERCESTRVAWFTPEHFGREAGIFLCLECGKLNIRLRRGGARLRPAVAPVAVPVAEPALRRR